MKDKPISNRQLAFLIYLLLPGSSLVFMTGAAAGQDAWIASLLAMGAGLYVLWIIIKLNSMFPEQRITHISTTLLGRIPGSILNLFFLWSILLILLSFLFDLIMLLHIIYPLIPNTILYTLLVLPCTYILYKGLIALGRMSELFIWISILFLIASFLLALPLADPSNLKPVFESWKPIAAGTLYAIDWPFAEVVIFGLFLPMVSNLKRNHTPLYIWYLFSGITIVLLDLQIIMVLGSKLESLYLFPLYEVFRLSGFGDFQRVELFFFVLWFLTGIITITIYFQGLSLIIQDVFVLHDYKALILPLGLVIIVFSLYMFQSTVEYNWLGFKYIPVYSFTINLSYPTIIFVAAKFRQRRMKQKETASSAS